MKRILEKPVRMRDRFAVRVFGFFALSLLVVSGIFTGVFVYRQTQLNEALLLENGRRLAQILARGSRNAVYAENQAMLDDVVQGVLGENAVCAVVVLDEKKRPLLEMGKGERHLARARELLPRAREKIAGLGPDRDLDILEEVDCLQVWRPVMLRASPRGTEDLFFAPTDIDRPEEVIGFAGVCLDKTILKRETADMVIHSFSLFFVFLLAGSLAIYILARRATIPLETLSREVELIGRTGEVRPVALDARGEIGKLAESFNGMVENLQAREREKAALEERLRHAQTLEAVGTLARGIAHDFNNILATVKGAVHIMEKSYAADPFLMRYTGKIHTSLGRAQELIAGLITFSRTQEMHPGLLDLNELIAGLEPTLREIAGEGVRMEIALATHPVRIMGDDLGLKQVLLNLVSNARDAMPSGGSLRIAAAPVNGDQMEQAGHPSGLRATHVRLTVSDTGVGMDPSTQERIFEPFFTTKEVGRGTGLGLAIVHGIVTQHHGTITVHSAPGHGTEFRIDLPASAS